MTNIPTRLFAVLPHQVPAGRAAECLRAAAEAGDVAALLLRADDEGRHVEARVGTMVKLGRELDIAVLVEDDVRMAVATQADGVHVTTGPADAGAARRALGADAIVGGECLGKRDEAMRLGEAGVDYLALDQRLEAGGENLLDWWVEMFVVPVVAIHPAGAAAVAGLVRRGADFVRPSDDMWADAERAREVVARCMEAIREGAGE